ncbi:hypothetical protein Pen02_58550 [Plantactinospora endophytica]|uniref:Uncharacterized protein n=1 Tax=Plantactinospora endophytica TaxID=673535 RepID=A0ABQ4E8D9_9ACTN|nr:hypothetical protein Pen02_58550 [Plantactinospora endophytica]
MEAVEELTEFTGTHVLALDDTERVIDSIIERRGVPLSEDKRAAALDAAATFFERLETSLEGVSRVHFEVGTGFRPPDGGAQHEDQNFGEKFQNEFQPAMDQMIDALEANGIRGRLAMDIVTAYSATRVRKPRAAILYSSLLVTTVGACEVFLGDTMRAFLKARPEAMSTSEAKFSFSEVAGFKSIEAFRNYSINKQVDSILRQGSFDDWMKWFDDKLRIKYEDMTSHGLNLREVFQRRHIHVHNDGRVSDLYLLKLPDLEAPPTINTHLEITPAYLTGAIDQLWDFAVVLIVAVGRKLFRKDAASREAINNLGVNTIFEHLKSGKYHCVIELYARLHEGFDSEVDRLTTRVNHWVARSRLGDPKVTAEVEAWDTTTLSRRYQLAKTALQGDYKEAAELAGQLIVGGELTRRDYREWPLLLHVREAYPDPPMPD